MQTQTYNHVLYHPVNSKSILKKHEYSKSFN